MVSVSLDISLMILGCWESFKLGRDYNQQDTAVDRQDGVCLSFLLIILYGRVNIINLEQATILPQIYI